MSELIRTILWIAIVELSEILVFLSFGLFIVVYFAKLAMRRYRPLQYILYGRDLMTYSLTFTRDGLYLSTVFYIVLQLTQTFLR